MVEPPMFFFKNGYDYRLLRKGRPNAQCGEKVVRVALYSQSRRGVSVPHYEVHLVRVFKERSINGKVIPSGPRLASNEDFGMYGWVYESLPRALAKFSEFTEGSPDIV